MRRRSRASRQQYRKKSYRGDPAWIRTRGLQLGRLLLYPLSYGAGPHERPRAWRHPAGASPANSGDNGENSGRRAVGASAVRPPRLSSRCRSDAIDGRPTGRKPHRSSSQGQPRLAERHVALASPRTGPDRDRGCQRHLVAPVVFPACARLACGSRDARQVRAGSASRRTAALDLCASVRVCPTNCRPCSLHARRRACHTSTAPVRRRFGPIRPRTRHLRLPP